MSQFLEFAEGPLFRLSFALMILGLIRLLALSVINGLEAKSKAKDIKIPKPYVRKLTFGYLFPFRAFRVKPLYSFVSILFHAGLIITPILLFGHNLLFENSIGFSLISISLSKEAADILSIITIVSGLILLMMRVSNKSARFISRAQDFLWPLILIIPFASGLIVSMMALAPQTYQAFMLVHVLSGNLIFIMLPFTKIAHCILMPVSQWVTARSWKFPPEAGEEIAIALGKEGEEL